jgi:hypothetical protein
LAKIKNKHIESKGDLFGGAFEMVALRIKLLSPLQALQGLVNMMFSLRRALPSRGQKIMVIVNSSERAISLAQDNALCRSKRIRTKP